MPGKGGQVVEVRTFDAVSDGMTNVTPTFNAALASLATAAARACLVPRGTYLISGFSARGQTPISPEMKSKLKVLAEDPDLPDNARRAVRECLAR